MKSSNTKNILIVGVGGQGIVLASEVLASVCLNAGFDVKQSEVHGMAQRGGSVSSNVRFGEHVFSPTIARGKADVLLSFELLETIRWIDFISQTGQVIVNEQRIDPMPVASGKATYPPNILEQLTAVTSNIDLVHGNTLATQAGSIKTVNVVLLGVLSRHLEFPVDHWQKAIENRVPPKTIDINLKAFELGRQLVSKAA